MTKGDQRYVLLLRSLVIPSVILNIRIPETWASSTRKTGVKWFLEETQVCHWLDSIESSFSCFQRHPSHGLWRWFLPSNQSLPLGSWSPSKDRSLEEHKWPGHIWISLPVVSIEIPKVHQGRQRPGNRFHSESQVSCWESLRGVSRDQCWWEKRLPLWFDQILSVSEVLCKGWMSSRHYCQPFVTGFPWTEYSRNRSSRASLLFLKANEVIL